MNGIAFENGQIFIRGKREKLVSGAIHYFRVCPEYWEDRLLKLKQEELVELHTKFHQKLELKEDKLQV